MINTFERVIEKKKYYLPKVKAAFLPIATSSVSMNPLDLSNLKAFADENFMVVKH